MAIRSLVLLAFLAIPALAQAPRGFFAWWDSPIARDLNLTDSQVRQIRTTVREYRPQLVRLGILPDGPTAVDPLSRRQNAHGFDKGFCPDIR